LESTGSTHLVISNRPLQSSTSTTLDSYDPKNNAWAKKIADVAVRKVIVLGLAKKPLCIKRKDSAVGLEFEFEDGVSATSSRSQGGAGKTTSRLTIKDIDSLVVQNWDVTIDFTSPCSAAPAIDYEAAFQPSIDCPSGGFLCKNEGHIPSCIIRSRVNDGVCEPQCCDGSDETDGKIDCPNTCAAVGKEYRKVKDEESRKTRVGAAIRKDYITFGAKERARMEAEVIKLNLQVVELESQEKSLKVALDQVETEEAGETERKKDSKLYEQIIEMQSAIRSLREERALLEASVDDLSGILGDLSVSPSISSFIAKMN
jgi:alpha 1,3-glucosidase